MFSNGVGGGGGGGTGGEGGRCGALEEPLRGGIRLFIGAILWGDMARKMARPQLLVANDKDPT